MVTTLLVWLTVLTVAQTALTVMLGWTLATWLRRDERPAAPQMRGNRYGRADMTTQGLKSPLSRPEVTRSGEWGTVRAVPRDGK